MRAASHRQPGPEFYNSPALLNQNGNSQLRRLSAKVDDQCAERTVANWALVNVGLAPGMAPYFAVYPEPNGASLPSGIAQSFMSALNPVREDFGSERMNLEFRAEFFNVFNHPNFGEPNTSLFTQAGALVGSAGIVTNTLTTSRQIQFGLKLIW